MTPFERQVSDALVVAMGCKDRADAEHTYGCYDELPTSVAADDLAPHVAAAILAAIRVAHSRNGDVPLPEGWETMSLPEGLAALRALQAEPAPERIYPDVELPAGAGIKGLVSL